MRLLCVKDILNVAQFGNLGLAPAVAKKVAEHHGQGDLEALRSSVTTALVTLTTFGILLGGIILTLGRAHVDLLRLTPPLSREALTLLPYVAILSLYVLQIETLNSVLNGLGRLDLAVATQVASRVLTLAVSAVLLACSVGVRSLPIGALVGYTFLHIASHYLIRHVSGSSCVRLRSFNLASLRNLLRFGGGIAGCSAMNLLLGPFNKFMLARYAGPGALPVYDLAYTISMQLKTVFDAAFRSLMPEISRLASLGSRQDFARVHRIHDRSMRLILGVGAPLFLGALLFAPAVLRLWLGPRFRAEIAPAAQILILGAFFSLGGSPAYYLLVGVGRLRPLLLGTALQSLANAVPVLILVALGWSFSPRIAATATAAGMACGAAYLFFAARRFQPCP